MFCEWIESGSVKSKTNLFAAGVRKRTRSNGRLGLYKTSNLSR